MQPPLEDDPRPSVGGDVGVLHSMTFSDGRVIENPRIGRRARKALRRRERELARCKRGSKRRAKARERLARAKATVARARKTYLHQETAWVAREYGAIFVEGLAVRNMVRTARGTVDKPGTNVAQKAGLNREMQDVAPATLVNMLVYKAARAGGRVIKVDPRGTSQRCSGCGVHVPKALSVRVHRCDACGLVLDRDVNAARNILAAGGVVVPAGAKQELSCLPEKAQCEAVVSN